MQVQNFAALPDLKVLFFEDCGPSDTKGMSKEGQNTRECRILVRAENFADNNCLCQPAGRPADSGPLTEVWVRPGLCVIQQIVYISIC